MKTAIGIALCVALSATARATLILDDFRYGPFHESTMPAGLWTGPANPTDRLAQTALPPSHVLGGQRYVRLDWQSGAGAATSRLYPPPHGGLTFNNESDVRSALTMEYGRNIDGSPDPLHVDLLSQGLDAWAIRALTDASNHPLRVTIEMTDAGGQSGAAWTDFYQNDYVTQTIPFTAYGGLDLSDIVRIRVYLASATGAAALDAAVDYIAAIPEPVSLWLLCLGGLLLHTSRRRRQNNRRRRA